MKGRGTRRHNFLDQIFDDSLKAGVIPAIKALFKAYATSDQVRQIIDNKGFTVLATHPMFSTRDFKAVPAKCRVPIPEYIKDYVSLNQFAA